jgi:molybdopterin-guanine dinucleotide biosynthesis protein A
VSGSSPAASAPQAPGQPVAAAVIAGGPARRLGGVTKAMLTVQGRSIAARQLELLRDLFPRVIVVANDPAPWRELSVEIVPDRLVDQGPLGGIHAALTATPEHAGVVCVAGDMPFIAPELLRRLRDRAPEALAVAARSGGRPEPLLARYDRRVLPVLEAQLRAGRRAAHELLATVTATWLDELELRAIDPDLRSFINVNTPEDLARAERVGDGPAPP